MTESSANLLKRLDLIKDSDPFNKRILNDCFTEIQVLRTEIDRLKQLNTQLNKMVTQLESGEYERS
jgi:cell division protein FtsB